jgi:hypothetical protein
VFKINFRKLTRDKKGGSHILFPPQVKITIEVCEGRGGGTKPRLFKKKFYFFFLGVKKAMSSKIFF